MDNVKKLFVQALIEAENKEISKVHEKNVQKQRKNLKTQ